MVLEYNPKTKFKAKACSLGGLQTGGCGVPLWAALTALGGKAFRGPASLQPAPKGRTFRGHGEPSDLGRRCARDVREGRIVPGGSASTRGHHRGPVRVRIPV